MKDFLVGLKCKYCMGFCGDFSVPIFKFGFSAFSTAACKGGRKGYRVIVTKLFLMSPESKNKEAELNNACSL